MLGLNLEIAVRIRGDLHAILDTAGQIVHKHLGMVSVKLRAFELYT
jgi:hypothetical protein